MKKTLVLMAAYLSIAGNLYAGDLIVNGNVGVGTGTATPADKIDIANGSILATNLGNGGGKFGNIEVGYKSNYNAIRNTSGLYLNYDTNANVVLVGGTSTGNVGIGTTSPGYKLDVSGTGRFAGQLNADGNIQMPSAGNIYLNGGTTHKINGADIYLDTLNTGSASDLLEINYRTGGNVKICSSINCGTYSAYFNSSGNVGIGTSSPEPNHKLTVAGPALIGGVHYPSDKKFKKNIQNLTDSLNKILSIEGISYEFKIDEYPEKGFTEGKHYGVIAQDLEKIFPELVVTNDKDEKAVDYIEIIPVLIEAIKAQQKEIEELKSKVK